MPQRRLPALQPAPPEALTLHSASAERKHLMLARQSSLSRKRAGVNVNGACEPCRKGKRRCDGEKPACGACVKRDITQTRCVYDQMEGLSRAETLKHNAKTLRDERDILRTFVKEILNVSPGTTIEELIQLAEEQGLSFSEALGDNVKQLAVLRKSMPGQAVPGNIEGGALTPIMSATISRQSDSSPAHDDYDDHGLYGTSVSSGSVAGSLPSTSPTLLSRTPTNLSKFDDRSAQVVQAVDIHSAQSDAAVVRHQALVALCERMTREINQDRTSLHVYQEQENELHLDHLQPRNHVQIYAHMPTSASIRTNGYPPAIQDLQILNFQVPIYMIQPLSLPDESPFSKTISGFLELARARVGQGWPLANILGPDEFDVSSVVTERQGFNSNFLDFSVPGWAISVMMTFPDLDMVHRLAGVLQMARIMRWLISPTPESYAALSESQRPTPAQRMIPHKAEYDYPAIPACRDALINRPRDYIQSIVDWTSCDWPTDLPCAVFEPTTNSFKLAPGFEQCVGNEANWVVGPPFLTVFPELRGKCHVREIS